MTQEQRQRLLLAGLLAVLVLFGGRTVLRLAGGDGARRGPGELPGVVAGDLAVANVVKLRLADLEFEPAAFEVGRNPFRFEAVRRNRPKPTPQREPNPEPAPRARVQPPPRTAPPGPKPPNVDVVYLGRFGTANRPIAVFSDGKEIFNALEGGVLKEKFVVDNIGYESADLKFVGFPDTPAKRLAVGG